MNTLREPCKCGHEKATHFEEKHTCLAMHCDCRKYRDRDAPDERPLRQTPWRLPINTPLAPHPPWCTCGACDAGRGRR